MAEVLVRFNGSEVRILLRSNPRWVSISGMDFRPTGEVQVEPSPSIVTMPARTATAGRSLEENLEEFKAERIASGQSRDYVSDIVTYVRHAAAHGCWSRLTDATEDSALAYLSTLTTHDGGVASPKYYNNVLGNLRTFFAWAKKRKRIDANPVIDLEERIDRRGEQIRPFTPAEFVALITFVLTRGGGAEAAAVYEFAALTGFRRGELKALRKCDLHLEGREPFVELQPTQYKGGRKKYRSEKVPLVSPQLVERLRERVRDLLPTGKVFPTIPHPNVVLRDVARARIKLEDGKEKSIENPDALGRRLVLHSLRHMLGTNLAIAGVDIRRIQAILRHRDIKTTQRYIDAAALPTAAAMREGIAVFGTFFSGRVLDDATGADLRCHDSVSPGVPMMTTRQAAVTQEPNSVGMNATGSSPVAPISTLRPTCCAEQPNTNLPKYTDPKVLSGQPFHASEAAVGSVFAPAAAPGAAPHGTGAAVALPSDLGLTVLRAAVEALHSAIRLVGGGH